MILYTFHVVAISPPHAIQHTEYYCTPWYPKLVCQNWVQHMASIWLFLTLQYSAQNLKSRFSLQALSAIFTFKRYFWYLSISIATWKKRLWTDNAWVKYVWLSSSAGFVRHVPRLRMLGDEVLEKDQMLLIATCIFLLQCSTECYIIDRVRLVIFAPTLKSCPLSFW